MTDQNEHTDTNPGELPEELLQQLFHLKRYEAPEASRMVKNKQNIMRRVRESHGNRSWSLSHFLDVSIPWFFAEPRYGIAALFVVFATLQFWGVNAQKQLDDGIQFYAPSTEIAKAEATSSIYTNTITYPKLPDDLQLFPKQRGDNRVKFVGRIESDK